MAASDTESRDSKSKALVGVSCNHHQRVVLSLQTQMGVLVFGCGMFSSGADKALILESLSRPNASFPVLVPLDSGRFSLENQKCNLYR